MKRLLIALGVSGAGFLFSLHMFFKEDIPKFKSGDCIAYKELYDQQGTRLAVEFEFKIWIVGAGKYHSFWIKPNIMKNQQTDFDIDVADYGMKKIDCPNE